MFAFAKIASFSFAVYHRAIGCNWAPVSRLGTRFVTSAQHTFASTSKKITMAPRGKTKQQQVQEKEQEAQHEGPNEPQKEEEEPQEPQEEVAPVPQEETKEPQLEEDKSKDAEEEEAKVSGYVAEFFQTAIEKGAQAVVRDPDGQLRMIYKDKHDREQYEVEAIEAHKICGNSYR